VARTANAAAATTSGPRRGGDAAPPPGAPARLGRPITATVLLGLGLGGFVDGILLHQVMQWHHMLSSAVPPASLEDLRLNTMADGLFHAATWVFTVAGLLLLWEAARRPHPRWPATLLWGGLLAGWGAFNLVEGLIDHHLLGIHHVNETVPPEQWILWDAGFLLWGAVMLGAGWWLLRRGRREAGLSTA
jgi:uncharacterized membrane protein